MNVPDELKYAQSHEWVRVDNGDIVTVGISDFAQAEMTELVYVELPEVGRSYSAGDEVAVVESVKSASDIYTPVSGEIVEVNEALNDNPSLVNSSPFQDGWMFKIKISDAAQLDKLLDANGYKDSISS
ncbi:glycine cleavage system protein GcvH [Fuerstiella marisgermanici]|uniref:Glycine cleavage system H protein n=1 Tax=Fuerstiella marisgermanici TaxID=1891926 RepID=A0A1P8W932_9PLAN|nr:glycine cleavage system protein GcvH [Fuerstiella marisgermanici]APZ90572.1 Glycine cleavage system H protein [Fuerstiella marisgermanici]